MTLYQVYGNTMVGLADQERSENGRPMRHQFVFTGIPYAVAYQQESDFKQQNKRNG